MQLYIQVLDIPHNYFFPDIVILVSRWSNVLSSHYLCTVLGTLMGLMGLITTIIQEQK